jgi:tripartite-type tricarboxylate transporter receptor subunit TctC
MKFPRRRFLRLAAGAAALPALPRIARAQTYPARPVHLIVGFAAGTSPDIFTRLTAQWLSQRLGQPFVVENRVGGGSNIATEVVAHSSPDGYTLLLVSVTNAINATLWTDRQSTLIYPEGFEPIRRHFGVAHRVARPCRRGNRINLFRKAAIGGG